MTNPVNCLHTYEEKCSCVVCPYADECKIDSGVTPICMFVENPEGMDEFIRLYRS
jgi:hypothetical protein